jgi:hypothetical protein
MNNKLPWTLLAGVAGYALLRHLGTRGDVTAAIAVATPPRSGPFCTMRSCVTAPYTDVAAFFPRDYLWMYPALLVTSLFVVLMACIHYRFEVFVITIDWTVLIIAGHC